MIENLNGVLLPPDDATYVLGALDDFVRILAEKRSQPTPKLAQAISQLRRATRKCVASSGIDTRSDTNGGSSRADEAEPVHDLGYATVSTAEAARILGVVPSAVRNLARRNPERLGSVRVRGSWRHHRGRVEEQARRKGRMFRSPPAAQGV